MKYLGIYSSQNVDLKFEKMNMKSAFHCTKTDKLPIIIGFIFVDEMIIPKFLAIQLDNSSTHESFELFEIGNIQFNTEKEMKDIASNIAEEIVRYNKDILRFYKYQ
ncbi:MAG: hypothetical protein IKV32_03460 [Muribaculaceae bacterium]|nr:hypothetical protein [Muribaculaceae bacterium]